MSERSYPVSIDEQERLAELERYRILDTAPEQVFDDMVRLAKSVFRVDTSLVSLVGDERQWFKARVGLEACETGRDVAFCTYAILGTDVMVVPDARADPRFADNPLVTGPPFIRFYAGAPLTTPGKHGIGTLCIFDAEPRPDGLSPIDRQHLAMLARLVIERLDARRFQLERHADTEALDRAADRLTATAAELDGQAQSLAGLARDGSEKAEAAAEGMRNLIAIGVEVDRDVTEVSTDIASAAQTAHATRMTMAGMPTHIDEIAAVASKIARIARMTNILAVNASVEAARSGEAGRGFAVIAKEVGALAAVTADATNHIRTTLGAIGGTVTQSMERCDALADIVVRIDGRSSGIAAAAARAAGTRPKVGGDIEVIATVAQGVGIQATSLSESTVTLLREVTALRLRARMLSEAGSRPAEEASPHPEAADVRGGPASIARAMPQPDRRAASMP